jgi:hypothetical protein
LDAAGETTPTLHTSIAPLEPSTELPPESIMTAVTVEEPAPLLMVGMSIWGLGITAAMLPLGFLALAASPVIVAANLLMPAR